MSKPNQSPKGSFSPASFASLRSISGESSGEPLRIVLTDIDEDPDQPRKRIDTDDLEPLAATIRSHGVLQPIGVYPPTGGRYRLAFGARRLRASKIAGRVDIPAILIPETQQNFSSQIIENQQRTNLSNSDLAAAVQRLSSDGSSIAQIALICNLKEYQVSAFRAVTKFPSFLLDRLDHSDVRGLYDLYRQWTKTPVEIEAEMDEDNLSLTITDARRIIESITAASSGSIVLDRENYTKPNDRSETDEIVEPAHLDDAVQSQAVAKSRNIEPGTDETPAPPAKPDSASKKESSTAATKDISGPVFFVAIGEGERGELVLDRAGTKDGWALVRFSTGVEEIEFVKLRNVAIEAGGQRAKLV